jgi:tRNA threonylcarbamoyl adenosine modification protein YeaZ
MTKLVVSMLSSKALMALFAEDNSLCEYTSWAQQEGKELSDELPLQLSFLFQKTKLELKSVSKIYVFQGPGSFTGLRVSASFAKGLSTALEIPMIGIPSFRLYGEPFAISLRAAKAKSLSLEECVDRAYKFLEIKNDKESEVVLVPKTKILKGLKSCPLWPEISDIEKAIKHSSDLNSFEMNYGFDPSFVEST